jgi:AcrR family transcriptional regulator
MPRKKKTTAITRRQLYERVWAKPLSVVAGEMGISANALTKICNRLLVPYPTRGYWTKINAGKRVAREALPPEPERQTRQVTISGTRAKSRRVRTRLTPAMRRDHLLEATAEIIKTGGLHAASMKRIAATAGISETQAYNYFGSREELLTALARREHEKIQEARFADMAKVEGHYAKIMVGTRTYLRQVDKRGGLLQMLMSSPEVREAIKDERRRRSPIDVDAHARSLVEMYGISKAIAAGCTIVTSRLCLRAGKLIADRKISLEAAERLCLSIVLEGSRAINGGGDDFVRAAQRDERA